MTRTPQGQWRKGQSGNPGGLPKGFGSVREAARQHTAAAIATLAGVMADDEAPPAARVTAANALLDRGWGKPTADMTVQTKRDPDDYTDAELIAIIAGAGRDDDPGAAH
jgi:hypothetical protein